jgi:hypothetical protein
MFDVCEFKVSVSEATIPSLTYNIGTNSRKYEFEIHKGKEERRQRFFHKK